MHGCSNRGSILRETLNDVVDRKCALVVCEGLESVVRRVITHCFWRRSERAVHRLRVRNDLRSYGVFHRVRYFLLTRIYYGCNTSTEAVCRAIHRWNGTEEYEVRECDLQLATSLPSKKGFGSLTAWRVGTDVKIRQRQLGLVTSPHSAEHGDPVAPENEHRDHAGQDGAIDEMKCEDCRQHVNGSTV